MREEPDGIKTWVGEFRLEPTDAFFQSGELRHHPTEGIELRISGKSDDIKILTRKDYQIIQGRLEGFQDVTLIDCFDNGRSINIAGFQHRRIVANFGVLGLSLSDVSARCFKEIEYRSPALTWWYDCRGVDLRHHRNGNVSITYRKTPRIRCRIDSVRSIEIWSGPTYSPGLDSNGQMNFGIVPCVNLRYSNLATWSEVLSDSHWLEMFFCLAAGQFTGPPEISLATKRNRKSKDKAADATLLISQPWHKMAEPKHVMDRNFLLEDVRDSIGDVIGAWFEHREKFRHLLPLYRTAIEHNDTVETRFLLLAQATEALHRETIGGTLLPSARFATVQRKLLDALPDQLPSEVRQVISTRIDFMNEPGLRRRLKELFSQLDNKGRPLFYEYKRDASLAAKYRNEFAHVLRPVARSDKRVNEVAYLADALRAVFELSLLRLIGIPQAKLAEMFGRNRRFSMLQSNRRELFE